MDLMWTAVVNILFFKTNDPQKVWSLVCPRRLCDIILTKYLFSPNCKNEMKCLKKMCLFGIIFIIVWINASYKVQI